MWSTIFFVLFCSVCLEYTESGRLLKYIHLSLEDKKVALNEHNKYRRQARPSASNMEEMIWDSGLASQAVYHSSYCEFEHSSGAKTNKFDPIGENLYYTSEINIPNEKVIKDGLQAWFEEIDDYNYNTRGCSSVCGHYTQMVWATTYAVGCGISACKNLAGSPTASYLVCNYGPAGNYPTKPYKSGSPCSACPNNQTCFESLCRDAQRQSSFSKASSQQISLFTIVLAVVIGRLYC